jgi:hypothetical protein
LNVGKHPTPLELLEVVVFEVRQLGAAQATTQQHEEHGAVALTLEGFRVRRPQQLERLVRGRPLAQPYTQLPGAFDPGDARGDDGVKQTVVRRLGGKLANRSQANVDGGGRQLLVAFQVPAILLNQGFVERLS